MTLTTSERMELQRQARASNRRADSARHARLILLRADGLTWAKIRLTLDCHDRSIDRWSQRCAADRLAGLFTRYAGRARDTVTDRIEARVLAWTTTHTLGDGSTHWHQDGRGRGQDGAARHPSAEFVAFLPDSVTNQTNGKELHMLADTRSAHGHEYCGLARIHLSEFPAPPLTTDGVLSYTRGSTVRQIRQADPID